MRNEVLFFSLLFSTSGTFRQQSFEVAQQNTHLQCVLAGRQDRTHQGLDEVTLLRHCRNRLIGVVQVTRGLRLVERCLDVGGRRRANMVSHAVSARCHALRIVRPQFLDDLYRKTQKHVKKLFTWAPVQQFVERFTNCLLLGLK